MQELTTVPMGGVGAQADITGDQKVREGLSQQTDSLNSWRVLRVSCRTLFILEAGEVQEVCLLQMFFRRHVVATEEHKPSPLLLCHRRLCPHTSLAPFAQGSICTGYSRSLD